MKTPEEMAEEYFELGFESARQQFVNAAKEFVYAKRKIETPPQLSHEEIRKFYVDNFGAEIPLDDEEAIFWAWTKSSHMQVISWLVYGFKAGLYARKPQWISVKDRLPELSKTIIAYGPRMHCVISQLRQDEEGYSYVGPYMSVHPDEVTHWYEVPELPKLPKEEK